MALFSKKKRTLEELLDEIKSLSADEKSALTAKLTEADSTDEVTEDTTTETEDEVAEETVAEAETETPADETPETVETVVEETEDTTEDVTPEAAETEDEAKVNEAFEAMSARLTAIEESYVKLAEKLEAMAEKLDEGNFGNYGGKTPEGEDNANGEDSRVMQSYYRKQGDARRY